MGDSYGLDLGPCASNITQNKENLLAPYLQLKASERGSCLAARVADREETHVRVQNTVSSGCLSTSTRSEKYSTKSLDCERNDLQLSKINKEMKKQITKRQEQTETKHMQKTNFLLGHPFLEVKVTIPWCTPTYHTSSSKFY